MAEPTSLREKKKADHRRRILAAARALFLEKGVEATTIRAVAKRAGVAPGTIFLYAPSKERLLVQVFQDALDGAAKRALRKPLKADPADDLAGVFEPLLAHVGADTTLSRALIRELLFYEGTEGAMRSAYALGFLGGVAERIARHQEAGTVRADLDPQLAAMALFGTHLATTIGLVTGQLPATRAAKALQAQLIALQVRGLAPLPSAGRSPGRRR